MPELVQFSDLIPGVTTVAFKTHNAYDQNTWKGKVIGIGDYTLVKNIEDLLPYYQNVKKTLPDMGHINTLTYYIFSVYENDLHVPTGKRVFAREWIDQSSLKIIDSSSYLDLRIYNVPSSDKQKIIDILSDHGYYSNTINK